MVGVRSHGPTATMPVTQLKVPARANFLAYETQTRIEVKFNFSTESPCRVLTAGHHSGRPS